MSSRVSSLGFLAYPLILALSLSLVSTPHTSASQPTKNVSITVPQNLNITDHGDHLFCTPAGWFDIATFFIGNFVAHAATVKSLPGEPAVNAFAGKILSLLFPTSGLARGLKGILKHAVLCKTPLETASKAGALCTVVRLPNWKPRTGDRVRASESMLMRETRKRPSRDQEVIKDPGTAGRSLPATLDLERDVASVGLQGTDIELENNPETQEAQLPADLSSVMSLIDLHGSIPVTYCFSWTPSIGEQASFLPSVETFGIQGRKIHGVCRLPPGYALALLPHGIPVSGFDKPEVPERLPATASSWWRRLAAALGRWVYSGYYPPERQLPRNCFPTRNPDTDFFVSNEISSSYSFSKGLIAVLQVAFSSVTLYRTKGDQIQRYGYAAFGLTVAPYLVMSVVNLVSTMLTPDYPALYPVASDAMAEASRRGGRFEGVVGSVAARDQAGAELAFDVRPDGSTFLCRAEATGHTGAEPVHGEETIEAAARTPEYHQPNDLRVVISSHPESEGADWGAGVVSLPYYSVFVSFIAVAIIGGLSGFKPKGSTKAQRSWTMSWLSFGIFIGVMTWIFDSNSIIDYNDEEDNMRELLLYMFYCLPAIGGFVVVAQMLLNYGTCVRIY